MDHIYLLSFPPENSQKLEDVFLNKPTRSGRTRKRSNSYSILETWKYWINILKKAESSTSSGESQEPIQSIPKNSKIVQKLIASGISENRCKGMGLRQGG